MDYPARDELIQFTWIVGKPGEYRFVSKVPFGPMHSPELQFFPSQDKGQPPLQIEGESYSPLEHLTLFRKFGEINPESLREIGWFANRWGNITSPQVWVVSRSSPSSPLRSVGKGTERNNTLEMWQEEIRQMKSCVRLFDALARRNDQELKQAWDSAAHGMFSADYSGAEDVLGIDSDLSLREKALHMLGHKVNAKLNHHGLAPALLALPQEARSVPMHLSFRPKDLIGALWLQLALALSGDKRYKSCVECGEPFEISLAGSRRNRIYCSSYCNQKAWRARHPEKLRESRRTKPKSSKCICGKVYSPPTAGRMKEYCSAACRQKAYRKRKKEQKTANQ